MISTLKNLIVLSVIFSGLYEATTLAKSPRDHDWQEAEEKAKNAVVQVVAHHRGFNWREPFKAPKQSESTGTAFFINSDGYLLSNFHVVDNASIQIYVPALGQKPVDAHIVGVCPEADVAYLKIDDKGMKSLKAVLKEIPYLTFGDSDQLFPAEPVLASGYPLGSRYCAVTVGVLAARGYLDDRSYLHITAPINPGNSGGPLLNLDGHVVGINSAGIPSAQNIGFGIPSFDVQILMDDLQKNKLVRKPNVGIRYNSTTDEHAAYLKNPVPAGVFINNVDKNSVAFKSGVREGDMLYSVNGYPVDSYGDVTVNWPTSNKVSLDEFFIRLKSKTKLALVLYRKGKKHAIQCDFSASKPAPVRFIFPDYEPQEVDYELIGGMCLMQLRLNHFDFYDRLHHLQAFRDLENQHKEVLIITRLIPESTFHRVGCLYEGALLKEFNGKSVKTLSDVREALKESIKTRMVAVKTHDNIETVVSADRLVKDETLMAQSARISSTKAMEGLKKALSVKVKK